MTKLGVRMAWGVVLVAAASACSSGGGGGNGGAGKGGAGTGAAAGVNGAAGTGAAGTVAGPGTAGTSATGTAGTAATGTAGTTAPDGGTTGAAGTAADAGAEARDAGPDRSGQSCAGRALSLATNGTGTAPDTARARAEMDLMTDLPIGKADRTIEFWMYVKPTDWVAEVNEIWVYGVGGQLKQLGLDFGMPGVKNMAGNHATLGPYTNGIYDDDTGVYLGITSMASQWVHVAVTWDGTALRTYVNGVVRITTPLVAGKPLDTTQSPFTMGCNPPYFGCFNGLVDELRIWNVARTDAQIMGAFDKALVGNEAGLVGYWKFDETPGSKTVADSVTTAGHTPHPGQLLSATDAGAPTFVTPDPLPPVACP